ncbi:MAG: hypothetical protein JWN03_805, partial [Nocardia sp.]|nr:hypothetical protein [Nocardia sp.]
RFAYDFNIYPEADYRCAHGSTALEHEQGGVG